MSLSHDIYDGSIPDTDRKHRDYGFILALVCMALALVVASVIFAPGITSELTTVGPYVGP
jgi:hypothetical protein